MRAQELTAPLPVDARPCRSSGTSASSGGFLPPTGTKRAEETPETECRSIEEDRAEAAAIAGCRFVDVKDSSHQSVLEAPEVVNRTVREFLEEAASRGVRVPERLTAITPR